MAWLWGDDRWEKSGALSSSCVIIIPTKRQIWDNSHDVWHARTVYPSHKHEMYCQRGWNSFVYRVSLPFCTLQLVNLTPHSLFPCILMFKNIGCWNCKGTFMCKWKCSRNWTVPFGPYGITTLFTEIKLPQLFNRHTHPFSPPGVLALSFLQREKEPTHTLCIIGVLLFIVSSNLTQHHTLVWQLHFCYFLTCMEYI